MSIKLSPSILSADFSDLGAQVRQLEAGGADFIHLDIMDGDFVPNLTFGPLVVSSLRKVTSLPLDVHMMVNHPELMLPALRDAGANRLTFHAEATPHLHQVVNTVKQLGLEVGLALNPATPLDLLDYLLDRLDQVLVMTVNPGWGGQHFIDSMCGKITSLRQKIERAGLNLDLQVDGGINRETVCRVVEAGANCLVIGSALFAGGDLSSELRDYRVLAEECWTKREQEKG
jgi:ribulose-phosphate 3-epimerase